MSRVIGVNNDATSISQLIAVVHVVGAFSIFVLSIIALSVVYVYCAKDRYSGSRRSVDVPLNESRHVAFSMNCFRFLIVVAVAIAKAKGSYYPLNFPCPQCSGTAKSVWHFMRSHGF